jgi:23S rRNA pseudouridine2605 synthase
MEERLQKIISRAGVASRRKAEELIVAGRVTVNGVKERELGVRADPERDEIRVDGKLISQALEHLYVMLHKPEGYVTTTRDPEGRPTVMKLIKRIRQRVYPVGRLDYDTSGLLLFTSDGDLARFITHPSSEVKKTYSVKVKGAASPGAVKELKKGPKIGGRPLKPSEARFVKTTPGGRHSWVSLTISEGRTRQIRRMCEAVGHPVLKLKRIALGPLLLGGLPVGEWRHLTDRELSDLRRLMRGERKKSRPAARKRPGGKPASRGRRAGKKQRP